ncbi:hypothetical protein HYV84_08365 [Candidatus Woesearchaeota archaeon]|nr:hypothetical protein [Candidatus Woesearchaeota archaeon]
MTTNVRSLFSLLAAHAREFALMAGIDAVFFFFLWLFWLGIPYFDQFFVFLREKLTYGAWLPVYLVGLLSVLGIFVGAYGAFKFFSLSYLSSALGKKSNQGGLLGKFLVFQEKALVPAFFIFLFLLVNLFGRVRLKALTLENPVSLALSFFWGFAGLLLIAIVTYTFTQFTQMVFLRSEEKVLSGIRKNFSFRIFGFLWQDLKIIIAGLGILLIVHLLAKNLLFTNNLFYLNYYAAYKKFVVVFLFLAGYFALVFNRVFFFQSIVQRAR